MKMELWVLLLSVIQTCVAQNITQNLGKRYFFKMGKNNNEFHVNSRVMYLNQNITDVEYPELEKKRTFQFSQPTEKLPKYDFSNFLDDEWNYDHTSNLNKTLLPIFIQKFYEETADNPDPLVITRILFNTNGNKSSSVFKFNLDVINPDNVVEDAELYVYWPLKSTSSIFKKSVVLRLYQVEKKTENEFNGTYSLQNPDNHKLFNIIYISKAQKGWQMFKVRKPINNWLNGEENLGLILTISTITGYDTTDLIEIFNDTNSGNFSTFVKVKLHINDSLSENNDIERVEQEDININCQRQSWTINFNKMGWEKFIIFPEEFTTYDCFGRCSKSAEELNHVKFLHMFQKRMPCCVPSNYLPLPIMYFDKFGDIAIKSYDQAIVTSCQCR